MELFHLLFAIDSHEGKLEPMNSLLPKTERLRLGQALKIRNLRPTRQRACVYGVILQKPDHPTADEIHHRVRKKLPTISLATVYNCLDTLVECELVKQVNFDRAPTLFCPNRNPHAHFRCKNTGEVHDFELDSRKLSSLKRMLPDRFEAEAIDLAFTGTTTPNNKNITQS